jgi:hypothetical protein
VSYAINPAATFSNCVSRANVSDGSGGYVTGFDCNFYHQATGYPFNLTPFITFGGASLGENELTPGYVVWTTNASDVATQTLNNPGSIMDVLDFDANLGGNFSSQVYVYWPGGPAVPSVATMALVGYEVLLYNPLGVELYDPGDGNHTFTVDDNVSPGPAESYINMINTGANGANLLGPGYGNPLGNTCVNVYAFDPTEELVACCSCMLTPNQVANLGVNANLLAKTQTGIIPTSVTIKLLNSLAEPKSGGTATDCNNSAYLVGIGTPGVANTTFPIENGLVAYVSTPGTTNGTTWTNLSEHPFIPATLSADELTSITGRCGSLIGNGSGYGICQPCVAGALGAVKL